MRGSRFVSRYRRCRVYLAFEGQCAYCGITVVWRSPVGPAAECQRAATLDHIDPDGGHAEENLALACWSCNCKKGDSPAQEFRKRCRAEGFTPRMYRVYVTPRAAVALRNHLYPGQV